MNHLKYEIISGISGEPLKIEVSVPLEKMVLHALSNIGFPAKKTKVQPFTQGQRRMLRFICTDFPKNRIDEFSWFAGEWYVRFHQLLNQHLN